ncbi:GAF domain-containing protein [Alteromonadaceae bacterium BrNp21-10]|nr:GAF domain-containing protein [Alteromonadaceae bacterium BrNp21-10]
MHATTQFNTDYHSMLLQSKGLLDGETDFIANLANLSAIIWMNMPAINWCGFYIKKQQQLVLGPFQGKPACIRIEMGKGVCGTAAAKASTQIVDDVHQFPGHIACDSASNSEIVLPILQNGDVIAVLDIDSPLLQRFNQQDGLELQKVVNVLQQTL